jgi:hypothetical protein
LNDLTLFQIVQYQNLLYKSHYEEIKFHNLAADSQTYSPSILHDRPMSEKARRGLALACLPVSYQLQLPVYLVFLASLFTLKREAAGAIETLPIFYHIYGATSHKTATFNAKHFIHKRVSFCHYRLNVIVRTIGNGQKDTEEWRVWGGGEV